MKQLIATSGKVLTSTIVGSMSGRREILAALDRRSTATPDYDYRSNRDEIWLDYIADTGDGWDASHSIAWLAGRKGLVLDPSGQPTPQSIPAENPEPSPPDGSLPAGKVLIFGGDLVYPTASSKAYQGHLESPYRSALFDEAHPGRDVFAIPGNHDWYDGLTGFIRMFCGDQGRTIGGWATRQHRSYFALALPHGWWLWGLDLALEDDVDAPQIAYFADVAKRQLKPDDKVILCVPTPSWVKATTTDPGAYREAEKESDKLQILSSKIEAAGASFPLVLTGDLHHYARYVSSKRNYIICGGGGAFMLGTAALPPRLDPEGQETLCLEEPRFPTPAESNRLRFGSLLFPFTSRGFSLALAIAYFLIFGLVEIVSQIRLITGARGIPYRCGSFGGALDPTIQSWFDALLNDSATLDCVLLFPFRAYTLVGATSFFLSAIVILVFIIFARFGAPRGASAWWSWSLTVFAGLLHGVAQLITWVSAYYLVAQYMPTADDTFWTRPLFFTAATLVVLVTNGFIFGLYLLLSNLALGMHEQEVFSSQAIKRYKSFLRICVSPKGVTVYPIGLRQPARRWRAAPNVAATQTRGRLYGSKQFNVEVRSPVSRLFDPTTALEPHLIHPPIEIAGSPAPASR